MSVAPKKVKPALFQFPRDAWHWVWLPELAEIIAWVPENVISTFRDLVKEEYDGYGEWRIGDLHWRSATGDTCCQNQVHLEPSHASIYIPAGFSNDVIQVLQWGVVRIGRVMHYGAPWQGALRDFYVAPDPQDPKKNRMAIVGFAHPTLDIHVPMPFGKRGVLLG